MDKLGIECIVRHQDESRNIPCEITDFRIQHLEAGKCLRLSFQALHTVQTRASRAGYHVLRPFGTIAAPTRFCYPFVTSHAY